MNVSTTDNVVVVQVAFAAYAALLAGIDDTPGPRLAYDGKILELMSYSVRGLSRAAWLRERAPEDRALEGGENDG